MNMHETLEVAGVHSTSWLRCRHVHVGACMLSWCRLFLLSSRELGACELRIDDLRYAPVVVRFVRVHEESRELRGQVGSLNMAQR